MRRLFTPKAVDISAGATHKPRGKAEDWWSTLCGLAKCAIRQQHIRWSDQASFSRTEDRKPKKGAAPAFLPSCPRADRVGSRQPFQAEYSLEAAFIQLLLQPNLATSAQIEACLGTFQMPHILRMLDQVLCPRLACPGRLTKRLRRLQHGKKYPTTPAKR